MGKFKFIHFVEIAGKFIHFVEIGGFQYASLA